MTTFGIVGQRAVPDHGWDQVRNKIAEILHENSGEMEGLTSLHVGAETIFAEELVRSGGHLIGVIPGAGYQDTFPDDERGVYERWRDAADTVLLLLNPVVDDIAALDAAMTVAERVDVLIVIWDGKQHTDGVPELVVRYAEEIGVPMRIIWVDDDDEEEMVA